jgi:hypothetical protein
MIENEVKLTVTNKYYGSQNVNFETIGVRLAIIHQRAWADVGYKNAEIFSIDSPSQSFRQSEPV